MMKALQSSLETVKNYYRLTKPGIIRGNILTALAGYLYAAKGHIDVPLLLTTLVGTTLVIASGCVFNNYIDRDIDSKMERTKKRALVVGTIQPAHALVFASIVGVVGFVVLVAFVNAITAIVGLIAFVSYVVVYAYAKRKTVHGTLVGSIPGALSLVAGYTAVTGQLDVTAAILFLIMVVWQMPHFYAIAIYRINDYKASGLPVISIKKGVPAAKKQIRLYIVLFGLTCLLLWMYSYASIAFAIVMLAISGYWLWYAVYGARKMKAEKWAKGVFGISLLVLLTLCVMLSVDSFFA